MTPSLRPEFEILISAFLAIVLSVGKQSLGMDLRRATVQGTENEQDRIHGLNRIVESLSGDMSPQGVSEGRTDAFSQGCTSQTILHYS